MTETSALKDLPLLVADVFELAAAFRKRGEEIAALVGRTQSEWQVLSAASGNPRTVPQIARRLGYARQSVQRTADALVREGLAAYVDNPDHKTSALLRLTDSGVKTLGVITKAADQFHRTVARSVDPRDLAATVKVLKRLCEMVERVRIR